LREKNHHYCNLFLKNEKHHKKLERHKQFILPRDLTKNMECCIIYIHDAITGNEQQKKI